MNWLRIGILVSFGAVSVLADVTYDESYGSAIGRYEWIR